jgi:alcohol dehydrogenase (NADP+)
MSSQKLTYLAGSLDGNIHVKTSVRDIGGVEVLVRVTHSGLCGTESMTTLLVVVLDMKELV